MAVAGQFKATSVHDSDSLRGTGHDIQIKVHCVGIDVPELSRGKHKPGQSFGQRDKKFLSRLILNKQVFIKCYDTGQNNLILAVVYVDRKNVNLRLIKDDLAEVH